MRFWWSNLVMRCGQHCWQPTTLTWIGEQEDNIVAFDKPFDGLHTFSHLLLQRFANGVARHWDVHIVTVCHLRIELKSISLRTIIYLITAAFLPEMNTPKWNTYNSRMNFLYTECCCFCLLLFLFGIAVSEQALSHWIREWYVTTVEKADVLNAPSLCDIDFSLAFYF